MILHRSHLRPNSKTTTTLALCFLFVFGKPDLLPLLNAQDLANSLSIQKTATGVQIVYSLASTNGGFFLLRSDDPENIFNIGDVIAAGIASNPIGVVAIALPTNNAAFFDLFQDPKLSISQNDFTPIDDGDAPEA